MIKVLDRHATGRNVIIMFAVASSVLIAANLYSTHFYQHTGGYGLLDLAGGQNAAATGTGYTPDGAYALLTRWGPVGRDDQLRFTLSIDAFAPIVTFLFLALALLYLTRPYRAVRRLPAVVLALPLAYLISDYGENSTILAMLLAYPQQLQTAASIGAALWTAKTVVSNLAVLAAVLAALLRLTSWLRHTSAKSTQRPAGHVS